MKVGQSIKKVNITQLHALQRLPNMNFATYPNPLGAISIRLLIHQMSTFNLKVDKLGSFTKAYPIKDLVRSPTTILSCLIQV